MSSPAISVIMAVHRDTTFLDDSIQSILNQTFSDFEFIIVANNCTDEFWSKLNTYKDQRIKLHRTNLGQLTFNLNFGINLAKADYIARMDDDDISAPERFEKQIKFMKLHQNIDILGTQYFLIDENGQKSSLSKFPLSDEQIKSALPFRSFIAHPSIMARKKSIISIGGYHYGDYAEDLDLWIRMKNKKFSFANLNEPLLLYRQHANQSTSRQFRRRNFSHIQAIKTKELIQNFNIFLLSHIIFGYIKFFIKSIFRKKS